MDWLAFDSYVAHVMGVYSAPGVSVAVAVDGKEVYSRGYGWRDREATLAATENTVYGIGSITKSVTAVAIMQLVESGRLSVLDPIGKYLPEFKFGKHGAEKSMLIHHFLTHTTGMAPLPSLTLALGRSILSEPDKTVLPKNDSFDESRIIDTYEQLCAYMASLDEEAMGAPGMYMSYSNESWALLGKVVERVAGMPYEEYVREHILRPLGMDSSGFIEDLPRFDEVTTIYSKWGGPEKKDVVAAPVWWEAPSMIACGFLKSTVKDLLKYMELYRTRGAGILDSQSVDRIMGLHTRYGPVSYYGYGLSTQPNYHGTSLVGHSGGLKGISAHVYIVPEKGITVAVLCNLSNVPSGNIALAAINTLLALPVTTRAIEFPDYACPAWRLPRYMGEYKSGEGARFVILAEGESLFMVDQKEKTALRPVGVDLFVQKDRETETALRFLTQPSGDVWAVEMGSRILKRIS